MSRTLPSGLRLPVIFAVALGTGFSGAVVPGSLLAVVVSESVRLGWLAGPVMMIGHAALELVAVVLLITGLIRFARSLRIRAVIGLVGGAVLVYLGYLTLGVQGEAAVNAMRGTSSGAGPQLLGLGQIGRLILLGGVMSAANPYWWLWWATVGTAHIGWAGQRGRAGGSAYFVGHILSDVTWYCAVSVAIGAGRAVLSAGVLRGIYVCCGLFLIAMGLCFAGAGTWVLARRRTPSDTDQAAVTQTEG
jgi:threonine/homoserine/homoserine lactone efflux protein